MSIHVKSFAISWSSKHSAYLQFNQLSKHLSFLYVAQENIGQFLQSSPTQNKKMMK